MAADNSPATTIGGIAALLTALAALLLALHSTGLIGKSAPSGGSSGNGSTGSSGAGSSGVTPQAIPEAPGHYVPAPHSLAPTGGPLVAPPGTYSVQPRGGSQ